MKPAKKLIQVDIDDTAFRLLHKFTTIQVSGIVDDKVSDDVYNMVWDSTRYETLCNVR